MREKKLPPQVVAVPPSLSRHCAPHRAPQERFIEQPHMKRSGMWGESAPPKEPRRCDCKCTFRHARGVPISPPGKESPSLPRRRSHIGDACRAGITPCEFLPRYPGHTKRRESPHPDRNHSLIPNIPVLRTNLFGKINFNLYICSKLNSLNRR